MSFRDSKKQQPQAKKLDPTQTTITEVQEFLRLVSSYVAQVEKLQQDEEPDEIIKNQIKRRVEKMNDYMRQIPPRMKKLEQVAHSSPDETLFSQLEKLKSDVRKCTNKIKTITYESNSPNSYSNQIQMYAFKNNLNIFRQANEVKTNNAVLKERAEEFKQIATDMQDIHGIVTELNGIVKEQGSKLDLIETQVEDAKINVHVGTENIQTSDSWHSKFSFGLFNWF